MSRPRNRAGFSLIELLAAVLLTAIVLGVATDGLLDLTRQSEAAIREIETPRRALTILDRVARDLEATIFVMKEEQVDPLYHPWIFYAEDDDVHEGAERATWISSGRRPRSEQRAVSNLEQVSWWLERDELGEAELRRGTVAGLPLGLDRDLPEDGALIARNIATFGLRFRSAAGEWHDEWDSSLVAHASDIPIAAEIALSLYPNAESEEAEGPFRRTVLLPLRPIQIVRRADEADSDSGGDYEDESEGEGEGGMSLSECLSTHPELLADVDEGTADVVSQLTGSAASLEDLLPFALPADCL